MTINEFWSYLLEKELAEAALAKPRVRSQEHQVIRPEELSQQYVQDLLI